MLNKIKVTILLLSGLLVANCGGQQQVKEIQETRTIESKPVHIHAQQHACPMEGGDVDLPVGHPPLSRFTWQVPDTWTEGRPTPMRAGNFGVADNPNVECYLTVLTGMAGGILANVNRWRQQMGLPDINQEAVDALPTIEMLGQPACFLDIEGDFTGMSGRHEPGYRMLAVICVLDDETVFVKMTGPADAVQAEKERFLAFCASLEEGSAFTHAAVEKSE